MLVRKRTSWLCASLHPGVHCFFRESRCRILAAAANSWWFCWWTMRNKALLVLYVEETRWWCEVETRSQLASISIHRKAFLGTLKWYSPILLCSYPSQKFVKLSWQFLPLAKKYLLADSWHSLDTTILSLKEESTPLTSKWHVPSSWQHTSLFPWCKHFSSLQEPIQHVHSAQNISSSQAVNAKHRMRMSNTCSPTSS